MHALSPIQQQTQTNTNTHWHALTLRIIPTVRMTSLSQLRQRLEREAGVLPSSSWLGQCLLHIREANNNNGSTASIENTEADEIWDQIRYSDLRNVIREPNGSASINNVDENSVTAAMKLRQAIAQSKMSNSNDNRSAGSNGGQQRNKVCLSKDFQLMIQLEEVIDASMNSEQRLASMGGNAVPNNNGTNNNFGQGSRSEKWRCLKMVFSDGYYSSGRASPPPSNTNDHDVIFYAMETSPIAGLSTSSVPGTKVLLHGPIQIRHGLLQLSDENAFVIGGQVPSWRQIWTKAREKAQREKGLGVDPTIKALIWNPLMGDEEEADEGEGESRDVTIPRAPPPAAALQRPIPTSNQAPPVITPNHATQNQVTNNGTNITQTRNTTNMHSTSRPSAGNMRQTTLDAYPKQNRATTSNPYQRSNNKENTTQRSTMPNTSQNQQQPQISNPYSSTMRQPQQQRSNPYASLRPSQTSAQSSTSTIANDLTKTEVASNNQNHPEDAIDLTESPANVSNDMDTSRTKQVSISSGVSRNNALNPSESVNSGLSGILTLSEFKTLMQSLRHNRVSYEQHYGKEIIVLCKISPDNDNKVFNIVKANSDKKIKGKKDKKYKFFLVSTFYGSKQSDGPIACQVLSSLMEPFFQGHSPGEIRKLSREDKVRGNRIVTQSSTAFIHEMSSMGRVHIKLMLSADDFFEKISSMPSDGWLEDTKNPLLLVVKRTSF